MGKKFRELLRQEKEDEKKNSRGLLGKEKKR